MLIRLIAMSWVVVAVSTPFVQAQSEESYPTVHAFLKAFEAQFPNQDQATRAFYASAYRTVELWKVLHTSLQELGSASQLEEWKTLEPIKATELINDFRKNGRMSYEATAEQTSLDLLGMALDLPWDTWTYRVAELEVQRLRSFSLDWVSTLLDAQDVKNANALLLLTRDLEPLSSLTQLPLAKVSSGAQAKWMGFTIVDTKKQTVAEAEMRRLFLLPHMIGRIESASKMGWLFARLGDRREARRLLLEALAGGESLVQMLALPDWQEALEAFATQAITPLSFDLPANMVKEKTAKVTAYSEGHHHTSAKLVSDCHRRLIEFYRMEKSSAYQDVLISVAQKRLEDHLVRYPD